MDFFYIQHHLFQKGMQGEGDEVRVRSVLKREPSVVWLCYALAPLNPPPLNPGQQFHLSSLTYRNLTQLETFNGYLNTLQDDFSQ